LQKQLHKKQKGSKRYWKLRNQIRKEHEHISNQKKDVANKIVHKLLSENDIIYFQDEQISKWRKKKRSKKNGKKCGFSFGRQVQSSCLGRVKQKLIDLEKTNRSFKISKWMPTTKFCPNCGCLNTLTLADRTYVCDCGYTCDRDIHASKNVLLFGSTKRAECLEQTSAEVSTSMRLIDSRLISQVEPMKRKQETYTI
jgi:putative transposase